MGQKVVEEEPISDSEGDFDVESEEMEEDIQGSTSNLPTVGVAQRVQALEASQSSSEGSSLPVAQVQASSSLPLGQFVHSGGSSSLSSSSSFSMNVSQAPTSQDKSFKLEG